jgi:lysophospholipase L1-like esterase
MVVRHFSVDVVIVNAGVGGTESDYGALRVRRDVLAQNPDLVVVDYAVNDGPEGISSFESLIRILLEAQLAVLPIMLSNGSGQGQQDAQVPVLKHYDVPIVSYRDPVTAMVATGATTWAMMSSDGVHPTDLGHQRAGEYLISYFVAAKRAFDAARAMPAALGGNAM